MKKSCYIFAVVLLLAACGGKQDEGAGKSVSGTATKAISDAAKSGDLDKVKELLSKGADIDAKNEDGETLLHLAVMRGSLEVVEFLIAKGANVNARSKVGTTPLHELGSLVRGNSDRLVKTAKLLLEKGAAVNAKSDYGKTPLHTAVSVTEDEKLAALYVSRGADVNARNDRGYTPLDRAVDCGNEKAAEFLRERGGKMPDPDRVHMMKAAKKGDIDKLQVLLRGGADIHVRDSSGFTLLHVAAREGQKEVVEFLIANGAQVDAEHWYGTPLLVARTKEIAEILLSNGADINARNIMRKTVLHMVVKYSREDETGFVKLLLEAGADVNAIDGEGKTPLDYAEGMVCEDVLRGYGAKSGSAEEGK